MAELRLRIETDTAHSVARLKLARADGTPLAHHEIRLPEHSSALWEGLFDTRRYVERYQGALVFDDQQAPATAESLLGRLGLFLGERVLGAAMVRALAKPARKTLIVQLPTPDRDVLAAAFARVPWEIARLTDGTHARNLAVRALAADTPDQTDPNADDALALRPGETLRALFVFAEAPGARPLAMRLEREALQRLFAERILPHRRVELDLLCHGVDRRRLHERIRARRGYHLVHWSGHGHHNALELQGEPDHRIAGESLVELFAEAGGFIPRLFFLSACHSGALLEADDWPTLKAALERDTASAPGPTPKDSAQPKQLEDAYRNPSGYTGTALALLASGVPQVIAMRYAVGDDYARRLATAFYGRLLADGDPAPADEALALARADLAGREDPERAAYHAVDHATPLLFGRPGAPLVPSPGRSPQLERLLPRPWPLLQGDRRELDPPAVFVGHGEALARLGERWLGDGTAGTETPAVALIQGLAGLGKTALAAESIHLFHPRFDLTLAFQSKPEALSFDDLMRRLDERLTLASEVYRARCERNRLDRIALEHDPARFPTPERRRAHQRANLLNALRDQSVLLVLDNFERNLETVETAPGAALYRCADPQWDALLADLARALPATRSRLLMTSRHRPQALAEAARTLWVALGPLPIGEAGLFIRSHPTLRRLLFGADSQGQALVLRLLRISRGHPLILDRLARLAPDPPALAAALDRLQTDGWQRLPDLFGPGAADDAQREDERAYLEEVAVGSVDLLLERLTPDARGLLWTVALANEPVGEDLIEAVWQGPPVGPLLAELWGSGLLTREARPDGPPVYAYHELVRERLAASRAPEGRPSGADGAHDAGTGQADAAVRIGYAERYARRFKDLYHRDRAAAGEAGRRALVYFLSAGAFERLGGFASALIHGADDPALLRGLADALAGSIDQVPPGQTRWSLRTLTADARWNAGQPERSLPLYAESAAEAESAGHWSDLAWIVGNWAAAAGGIGDLDGAKGLQLRSAEAHRRAGRPEVDALASELEALRIDTRQGKVESALPVIDARLGRLRDWWRRTQAGETVAEAPDRTFLGRALVSGLNLAWQANMTLERWPSCLALLDEQASAQRAQGDGPVALAMTRFNRYGPLLRLGQLDQAQQVVEDCLEVYRCAGAVADEARCLSALATVWDRRGDTGQAAAIGRQALAVSNRLPDPSDRAVSHDNLGSYLEKQGEREESARHQAAALAYDVCTGARNPVRLRNLRIRARRALAQGARYRLPTLDALLDSDTFAPLREYLDRRGIDPAAVQSGLDHLVDEAHAEAASAAPG